MQTKVKPLSSLSQAHSCAHKIDTVDAEQEGNKHASSVGKAKEKSFYNLNGISLHGKPLKTVQTKLYINNPGDSYEQEADVMADKVMRIPDGLSIQRKCAKCEEEEEPKLQRKALSTGVTPVLQTKAEGGTVANPSLSNRITESKGGGNSMDKDTQSFMSDRLGVDFSKVKIHADNEAAQMNRELSAKAFTVGNDIFFNEHQFNPNSNEGRHLLAHELTHVLQQNSNHTTTAPVLQRQESAEDAGVPVGDTSEPTYSDEPLESDDELLACMLILPPWAWTLCFDEDKQVRSKAKSPFVSDKCKKYEGGGGQSGGGGASGSWDEASSKNLNFYHGTRWSMAKKMPGNVQAIGGGDFATGFYTHHDQDDSKALQRAIKWGRQFANKKPREPYAGVIRFGVQEYDYRQLFTGGKAMVFDLKTTDQKNFKVKQKEWLGFITSNGRYSKPVFNEKRKQWVHERRDPQPKLPYNIIEGPFYTPLKGRKDKMPAPEEFVPYAEGKQLPQQVLWANDGIALLNSSKVVTELKQYDAKTGKVKSPPDESVSVSSVLDAKQMAEASEEAQFSM